MARRRYQRPVVQSVGRGLKARWVVRFREDVINGTGQRVRVCRKTTLGRTSEMTRAMAQRAADDLLSKGANSSTFQPATTLTFEQFVESKYRPAALPLRKPAGAVIAKSHLEHHLIPWFGALPIAAVNQEAVQQMASALLERGLLPGTVRNICGTLMSIFKWARRWGYPTPMFRRGELGLPKHRSEKLKFFTLEEATAIFEDAGPFYGVLFQTQCALALRPGEVLGLMVKDFDFERGAVRIQRSAWRDTLQSTKAGNDVTLRLSPALTAVLEGYLQTTWIANERGLLFPGLNGHLVNQCNVRRLVLYPILKRRGFPQRGLHAFRHTAASLLADDGANQKLTGTLLRHQDGGQLAWLYSHTLGNAETVAMDRLGERVCSGLRKKPRPAGKVRQWRTA